MPTTWLPPLPATPHGLRQLAWRWRWPLIALAVLLVARLALPGIIQAVRDSTTVVALTHPVSAGTILTEADLSIVQAAQKLVPSSALRDLSQAQGRRTAADLPAGLPLAPEFLTDPGALTRAPPGTVAAPVRLSDGAAAAVLTPGARIDLLASAGTSHDGIIIPAQRLANAALVLSVPEVAAGQPGLILLALTSDEAALVSGAATWAVLSAVLVG